LPEEARAGRNVVFFSRRCDVLPAVRSAVESGEARLLARPSFEELISLYSMADAFVFPSWIEGFGLPVLEAMACGAPVVASNRGSIPEISGSAALLCDATDDAALAGHLERVLVEPGMAHSLRERGFAQAARFSWRKTAQRILAAYESAARA
jgi:glycosyltransferase involved in cell wall biosynthesis